MRVLMLVLVALMPSSLAAQAGRAAFAEGIRLLQSGQATRAEKQFERAIAQEPSVGEYHLWLGRAIGVQAQDASVVRQPFLARRVKAAFEKAVALDPSLLDARDGLIQFHLMAPGVMGGDRDEARRQQREIARRDAMRGHLAQATISWRDRDTVATERSLRAAVAAAPDSVAPVMMLGSRLAAWQRSAEAFAAFDAFLARHPQNAMVRYQFGRLAGLTGERLPDAERHLRAVLIEPDWVPVQWMPSKAVVQARLGDVLRRQGRKEDARSAYQAALAMDKDLAIAKDGLKALN